MKTFWRGLTDFVGFVVGPFFAVYYLLDFGHGPAGPGPYYYFYRHNSQLGVALGIALICLGLVMRSWRNGSSPHVRRHPIQDRKKTYYASNRRNKRPKQNQKPERPKQNQKPERPKEDKKPSPPDRNQQNRTETKPVSKES